MGHEFYSAVAGAALKIVLPVVAVCFIVLIIKMKLAKKR